MTWLTAMNQRRVESYRPEAMPFLDHEPGPLPGPPPWRVGEQGPRQPIRRVVCIR
jgi:hypothetical protein